MGTMGEARLSMNVSQYPLLPWYCRGSLLSVTAETIGVTFRPNKRGPGRAASTSVPRRNPARSGKIRAMTLCVKSLRQRIM